MPAIDRGTKRHCAACGAPYYDLNRDPAVCPKCHTPFVAALKVPVRPLRGRPSAVAVEAEENVPDFAEDEVLEHVDEDEDGLPPESDIDEERDEEDSRD